MVPCPLNCSAAWDSIQNLGFTNPVEDFVHSIRNKTLVHDVLEAEEKITDFVDQFCTGPTFEDSEKVCLSFTSMNDPAYELASLL